MTRPLTAYGGGPAMTCALCGAAHRAVALHAAPSSTLRASDPGPARRAVNAAQNARRRRARAREAGWRRELGRAPDDGFFPRGPRP